MTPDLNLETIALPLLILVPFLIAVVAGSFYAHKRGLITKGQRDGGIFVTLAGVVILVIIAVWTGGGWTAGTDEVSPNVLDRDEEAFAPADRPDVKTEGEEIQDESVKDFDEFQEEFFEEDGQ